MQTPQASAPKKKSAPQVLAAVAGGAAKLGAAAALSLLAWEAILGAWVFKAAPYHQDADFGWMPKPGAVAFTNIEGHAAAFYNERGFRDAPITPRKPGEMRVLCLGDSFVEALDVPREESFEFRLEQMLSKYLQGQNPPGAFTTARVFNAGRSGVTVATAVYLAPQYKKLFDPDLVVVMARDEWRIVFDRSEEIRYVPRGDEGRQGFDVEMFNHWEHSGPMFRRMVNLGVRELSVVSQGTRQLRLMRSGGGGEGAAPDAPGAGEKSDRQLEAKAQAKGQPRPKPPGLLENAAAWTPAQLKAAYPRLLVVSVPASSAQIGGMVPVTPTETAFLQACREQKLSVINMRSVIDEDFARTKIPPFGFPTTLPWQGHFNAHGHEITARALLASIKPRLQVLEDTKAP